MNDRDDLPIFQPRMGRDHRASSRSAGGSFRHALLSATRRGAWSARGKVGSARSRVAVARSDQGARRVVIKAHVVLSAGGAKAAALRPPPSPPTNRPHPKGTGRSRRRDQKGGSMRNSEAVPRDETRVAHVPGVVGDRVPRERRDAPPRRQQRGRRLGRAWCRRVRRAAPVRPSVPGGAAAVVIYFRRVT